MGVRYDIDCKHCGSHSEYTTWLDRSAAIQSLDSLLSHIDTECAIRCPVCRAKLNTTIDAFRSQVTMMRLE